MFLNEVEHVNDAPGAPVSVIERVDGLKAVMNKRHLDEGVDGAKVWIVDESFEIVHQAENLLLILWWGVNGFSGILGILVFQRGAGNFAESSVVLLQRALDIKDRLVGQ